MSSDERCLVCGAAADSATHPGLCHEHEKLVVDFTEERPVSAAGRRAGWDQDQKRGEK